MKNFKNKLSFLLILFPIIMYLIHFNFHAIYSTISNNIQNDNKRNQIDICCTWGNQLEDGILTYEISNAKPETKELVTSAISYWDQNIEGIQFKDANSKKK